MLEHNLTQSDWQWFADRITESCTGRVIVPSYAYIKFRNIYDNEFLSNDEIKSYLIDNVYNIEWWQYSQLPYQPA